MKLAEIEGIGPSYVAKLAQAGVKTPMALLKKGYTPDLRKELASETGISESLILDWVLFADLLRVEGIGVEYASLLEEIGIDSSEALAIQNVKSLAKRLKKSNEEKKLVYRLPTIKQLARAIKSASKIDHIPHGFAGDQTTFPPPPRKKGRTTRRISR
jgi:predicted flap endonuclease-1-like 5' DNA nuclease